MGLHKTTVLYMTSYHFGLYGFVVIVAEVEPEIFILQVQIVFLAVLPASFLRSFRIVISFGFPLNAVGDATEHKIPDKNEQHT